MDSRLNPERVVKNWLTGIVGGVLFLGLILGIVFFVEVVSPAKVLLLKSNSFIREKLGLDSWIPLVGISHLAVEAVILNEDDGFYRHEGYEPRAIQNAVKNDVVSLSLKRGGSTITQQVVKNLLLSRKKSFRRKIEEFILAREAEKSLGKERILEIYLNTAEFGPGLYGMESASRYYFDKKPLDLTAKEGAFLAMLLPSPLKYGKSFRDKKLTPYAERIIGFSLRRMVRARELDARQMEIEWGKPLSFEKVLVPSSKMKFSKSL